MRSDDELYRALRRNESTRSVNTVLIMLAIPLIVIAICAVFWFLIGGAP